MSEEDRLVGSVVADRYRVKRKLGEGGMGLVYLAVHEALRKEVALKVLGTTARLDAEAIARFEREAIAAANLKHPNIAEATDFGQLPGGGLYLVMEYVEGKTLRAVLSEEGKLPPERALPVIQQIASALTTAHGRDVVHRDLKPENVIVTPSAVKVIDFGIAKLTSATFGGLKSGLTSVGTRFGTPEYMSPEQVMGQGVDARADQYALGVLAFEVLTGKPPFKTEDVSQLMMMHVGAPVPSTRDSTPTLSPEVDAVVTKMLSKLPDERFASVDEAMKALTTAFTAPPKPSPVSAPVVQATVPLPPPAPVPVRARHLDSTMQSPMHPVVRPSGPAKKPPLLAFAIGGALLVVAVIVAGVLFGRSVKATAQDPDSWSDTAPPDDAPKGKAKGKGKKR